MNPIYIYLIIINAAGFLFMLADKSKAKKGSSRIPEKLLLGLGLLGGSSGCTLGMYIFHHKTRKQTFAMGFPAALFLHLVLLFFYLHK